MCNAFKILDCLIVNNTVGYSSLKIGQLINFIVFSAHPHYSVYANTSGNFKLKCNHYQIAFKLTET